MPQCAAFWSHCLNCLEQELPAQQFKTWILPLRAEELGGEDVAGLRLVAPSNFHRQWLRDRYLRRIEELGEEFFGGTPNIEVGLAPTGGARRPAAPSGSATATPPAASAAAPAQAAPAVVRPAAPEAPVSAEAANYDKSRLNPDFTFDTLVTGRANDLARAAALQVAQNPGVSYNPLFIYGGVGLGKTHLVHAVGNALLKRCKYMRLAHYLRKNRNDWSDGPDFARQGLDGFSAETPQDQEILRDLCPLVEDWDGDGRVFRDTKWSYDALFGLVNPDLLADYEKWWAVSGEAP